MSPDELVGTRWQHRNPAFRVAPRGKHQVVLEVTGVATKLDGVGRPLLSIRSVYAPKPARRYISASYLQETYEQLDE